MNAEIISKKTRNELREYFVGMTIREIGSEFDAAGIHADLSYEPPNISGERRTLVEQHYRTLNWSEWSDVRKFLTVYENTLNSLEETGSQEEWKPTYFKSLKNWIEKDGFTYEKRKLVRLSQQHGLKHISGKVTLLNLPELYRQIDRIQAAIDSDPDLAIGTAKEMVESVCKTILEEHNVTFNNHTDLEQLVKEARKALLLVPESIPESAKGADSIRRLLSNLGTITKSLGELRNLYGTGHGKSGRSRGLSPRHARLAVGAATTLATFLLETHLEKSGQASLKPTESN